MMNETESYGNRQITFGTQLLMVISKGFPEKYRKRFNELAPSKDISDVWRKLIIWVLKDEEHGVLQVFTGDFWRRCDDLVETIFSNNRNQEQQTDIELAKSYERNMWEFKTFESCWRGKKYREVGEERYFHCKKTFFCDALVMRIIARAACLVDSERLLKERQLDKDKKSETIDNFLKKQDEKSETLKTHHLWAMISSDMSSIFEAFIAISVNWFLPANPAFITDKIREKANIISENQETFIFEKLLELVEQSPDLDQT